MPWINGGFYRFWDLLHDSYSISYAFLLLVPNRRALTIAHTYCIYIYIGVCVYILSWDLSCDLFRSEPQNREAVADGRHVPGQGLDNWYQLDAHLLEGMDSCNSIQCLHPYRYTHMCVCRTRVHARDASVALRVYSSVSEHSCTDPHR